jgi:hypothetical protein
MARSAPLMLLLAVASAILIAGTAAQVCYFLVHPSSVLTCCVVEVVQLKA